MKESSMYPSFSIWAIELGNQKADEENCLFIRIFQQTHEEGMIESQSQHFMNSKELKGSRDWVLRASNFVKRDNCSLNTSCGPSWAMQHWL